MNFVHPQFLWALLALSIPIIIHLFNFRRYKRVLYSNVEFLRELKEQTAARSKLKHLLVLLSRLLAVAFLVFAFAQPFIPNKQTDSLYTGNRIAAFYLDNSFSMNAQSNDINLLDVAKKKLTEVAEAYGPEDRFVLLTNDFEGKHQRLVDYDQLLGLIEEVQPSPSFRTLQEVLERQGQIVENQQEKKDLYWFSDFQRDISEFKNDTSANINLVPMQSAAKSNLFIDSVWFEVPSLQLNQPNSVIVRIKNAGNADKDDIRVNLKLNGETKSLTSVSIATQGELIDTLAFTVNTKGWHEGVLEITDYPIQFDDQWYFAFHLKDQVRVLSINGLQENQFLNAAFRANKLHNLVNVPSSKVNYAEIGDYDMVILNELTEVSSGLQSVLMTYLEEGGSVFLIPSLSQNTERVNTLLKACNANIYRDIRTEPTELKKIHTETEIYKNVFSKIPRNIDYPIFNQYFTTSRYSSVNSEELLTLRDGTVALSRYPVKNGNVYVSVFPLQETASNFVQHSLFVPTIFQSIYYAGDAKPQQYILGKDEVIQWKANIQKLQGDEIVKLSKDELEIIPGQRKIGNRLLLSLNNQIRESGFYDLTGQLQDAWAKFGFNYNRKESILDFLSTDELQERFTGTNIEIIDAEQENLTNIVNQMNQGKVLWKWCIALTLLFLLLEIALLRFL